MPAGSARRRRGRTRMHGTSRPVAGSSGCSALLSGVSPPPTDRAAGRRDRRRTPCDRLALDLPPGPARGSWRAAVRFQDAAPDARAVVYAGIQADPLVARAATLLVDATQSQRILARAVMNGMSTGPAVWQAMFPTLFGPDAPPDGDERPRSEAI